MNEKKPKTHHPVNLSIPIDTWDKITINYIKAKQGKSDRKLKMSDFLVKMLDDSTNGNS